MSDAAPFQALLAATPVNEISRAAPARVREHDPEACHPDDPVSGMALVRQIAHSIARRLPRHVDRDELVSLGALGWAEARRRYDRARGVPFAVFAALRIRGAILDGLRQCDPLTRSERRRIKRTAEPQAPLLTCDPGELGRALTEAVSEGDPTEALAQRQLLGEVRRALGSLSPRERFVLERHFFDDRSMRSVGEELGVTESRISQIVNGALGRLRTSLAEAA